MTNSSTYIMDLPENVTMSPFSDQPFNRGNNTNTDSASYRQLNPHQNPYMQGQPRIDSMPLPEYGGNGGRGSSAHPPPPPLPPSYDFDQGPLGNVPQFSLPPKDIPLDMSGFRDESAKPNYVPQSKSKEDYVFEQEERIRESRVSEETRKSVQRKMDIFAELQIPVLVAVLFLIFQVEAINRLMARYLKFAGLFGEDGNLNITGMMVKSIAFGSIYYAAVNAVKFVE